MVLLQSSVVMRSAAKNLSHPVYMFPAEVKQSNALPFCFSFHMCPLLCLFSAMFLEFLCFILLIAVPLPPAPCSIDVLSSVLTCKKATGVLEKIYALNKICSGTIMCFRKKHTLNKVIY